MRLLVVEDNEAMADALHRGLTAEGFDVDVTHDGAEGLWRAREHTYAAVILDIMLPGMNGYEICRTMRSDGNHTPVLMLTAKDGDYDIAEGLDLGADDYLTKPFSFIVLTARIRALVRPRPSTGDRTLRVGTLCLDTATRSAHQDGTELNLTRREYSLLEALARNHGQPLTRTQLLDQAWDVAHTGESNVVDVYIGYLRKKLATDPQDRGPIETVRGVGYRLVKPQ